MSNHFPVKYEVYRIVRETRVRALSTVSMMDAIAEAEKYEEAEIMQVTSKVVWRKEFATLLVS